MVPPGPTACPAAGPARTGITRTAGGVGAISRARAGGATACAARRGWCGTTARSGAGTPHPPAPCPPTAKVRAGV